MAEGDGLGALAKNGCLKDNRSIFVLRIPELACFDQRTPSFPP